MGRWSYSNKIEANQLIKVTVFGLKKLRFFTFDNWKSDTLSWNNGISVGVMVSTYKNTEFVSFYYTSTYPDGETKKVDQKFSLATTICSFGGKRYWFICSSTQNGERCGRRVGVLYLSHKNMEFACRHCLNLTYSSRKLSGRYKVAGNIISFPDVDKAREAAKREYYNGKITRKYARYLKIATRAIYAYAMHLGIATEMVNERKDRMMKKIRPRINQRTRKRQRITTA